METINELSYNLLRSAAVPEVCGSALVMCSCGVQVV